MDEAKVAVITGGERGIGRGILERLLEEGWRTIALGVDDEAAAQLKSQLRPSSHCNYIHCDVANESEVAEAFRKIHGDFDRLDGLVLNAGIASPDRTPIDAIGIKDWQRVIDVNLTGPFLCAKHAFPALSRTGGSVVAIASTRACMSEPNTFAYSASKGGLLALTHSLAISLGPSVRVNSVSPGWIHIGDVSELSQSDHRQHPAGRVGAPADVSGIVSYLLGPDSGFVTGQDFVVDGGMTVKMIYE